MTINPYLAFSVINTMSNLGMLRLAQRGRAGAAKLPSSVSPEFQGLLSPAIHDLAHSVNRIASVSRKAVSVTSDVFELTMHIPAKVVKRALDALKLDAVTVDAKQASQFIQAASDIPAVIDEELEVRWVRLLTASASDDYHPLHSRILSELTSVEVSLLDSLIRMKSHETPIVPKTLTALNLPKRFFANGRLRSEQLSVALTVLERQKLVATSNNLGTYFGTPASKRRRLDPTGHEVTPLGVALHRVCSPRKGRNVSAIKPAADVKSQ